ncbi:MAG: hypothetical protein DSY33_05690 [Archaeoglobus sp.]|nr:MAG: hypothetical protein DSY33_05690 [Archaeoglobus sp.]
MEDKKISEMAELLCRGAKMLSYYCPDCNVPLFKNGEKIFCPVCGREAVFENELKEMKENKFRADDVKKIKKIKKEKEDSSSKSQINVPQETKGSVPHTTEIISAVDSVKVAILRVCRKMEREDEISSLEKKVKLVKELIEVVEKLLKLEEYLQ